MKKLIGWGAGILIGIIAFSNAASLNKSPSSTTNPSRPAITNQLQTQPKMTQDTTPKPKAETTETVTPTLTPAPQPKPSCNPNYTPCVSNSATDLDCKDIGFRVTVIGTDVYHLDADHDGYGCDSY